MAILLYDHIVIRHLAKTFHYMQSYRLNTCSYTDIQNILYHTPPFPIIRPAVVPTAC